MIDSEGDTERSSGVACRRLYPNSFKRSLAQKPSMGKTVKRDTAGQTEVLHPGLPVNMPRHAQDDLFNDFLNTSREIHLSLRDRALRFSRWTEEGAKFS